MLIVDLRVPRIPSSKSLSAVDLPCASRSRNDKQSLVGPKYQNIVSYHRFAVLESRLLTDFALRDTQKGKNWNE